MCRYFVLKIGAALYFVLQEEDGIRDGTVTGVQTCALPILILGGVGTDAISCETNARSCGVYVFGAGVGATISPGSLNQRSVSSPTSALLLFEVDVILLR